MKIFDRKTIKPGKFIYNPDLDNLPIPEIALEKAERARKFFEENSLPEHMRRK